jgi:hypothetical protein
MLRLQLLLLLTELISASIYLNLASAGWRNPAADSSAPVMGEPYAWATCLPVLAFMVLFTIVWGIFVVKRSKRMAIATFAVGLVVCVGSICIDFYHH